MTNSNSRIQAFDWLQISRRIDGDPRPFLEVRSGGGIRYLHPSRWERLRLRWAFRHFPVLPVQLLNSRDRRLILRLMQESPATERTHVDKSEIFGVVEATRWQPIRQGADSVSASRHPATLESIRGEPEIPREPGLPYWNLSNPEQRFVERFQFGNLSNTKYAQSIAPQGASASSCESFPATPSWFARGSRLVAESWFVRSLATPGVKILCASVGGVALLILAVTLQNRSSLRPTTTDLQTQTRTVPQPSQTSSPTQERIREQTQEPPSKAFQSVPKGNPTSPMSAKMASTGSLPSVSALDHQTSIRALIAPEQTSQSATALVSDGGASQTVPSNFPQGRMVSELPQVRLVYPTLSDPRFTGELKLMAWIAADGSVTRVSVLTGNPILAQSAIRAVRQWRYAPRAVADGSTDHSEEMAAEIKMRFFGQDAISIIPIMGDQKSDSRIWRHGPLPPVDNNHSALP